MHPKSRKEDIRELQSPSNWNVAQKVAKKLRPLADVIEDLKRKVLQAACFKQRAEQPGQEHIDLTELSNPRVAGTSTDSDEKPVAGVAGSSTVTIAQHANPYDFDSESLTPAGLDSSSIDQCCTACSTSWWPCKASQLARMQRQCKPLE